MARPTSHDAATLFRRALWDITLFRNWMVSGRDDAEYQCDRNAKAYKADCRAAEEWLTPIEIAPAFQVDRELAGIMNNLTANLKVAGEFRAANDGPVFNSELWRILSHSLYRLEDMIKLGWLQAQMDSPKPREKRAADDHQEWVRLHEEEGMSYSDIAERFHLSKSAIASGIRRYKARVH